MKKTVLCTIYQGLQDEYHNAKIVSGKVKPIGFKFKQEDILLASVFGKPLGLFYTGYYDANEKLTSTYTINDSPAKWGFFDVNTGNILVPSLYDGFDYYYENFARVELDGKYGFVDTSGNIVVPIVYEDAERFCEGLAKVKMKGKYGFVDTAGEVVIPAIYEEANNFNKGRVWVKQNGEYGLLDKNGHSVGEIKWDQICSFRDGRCAVRKGDKWTYMNEDGAEITGLNCDNICLIHDCAYGAFYDAIIIENMIYGFVNGIKKPPLDILFDPEPQIELFVVGHPEQMDFDDVVPQERIPARWGYYDINTGEILLPPAYDEAGYFVGDFAWVKRDGKYGFINREGNLVVDYIWDEIKGFNLGLCPVRQGEKWGYIDDNRILVIDLIFDEAGSFIQPGKYLINAGQYVNNSIARVRLGDKYGFINVNGGYIIEPSFEDTLDFWNIGYAGIKCAGKWGLINNNGMLVVVPQFDQIGSHYESLTTDNRKQHNESNYIYYFIVQTNGQWGIMDEKFNVVMPEPKQRYVVFQGYKIYINNGRVTSTRKIKTQT